MKKVFLLVAAAGLLVATPSCKKGENDPGLSLKSRKARLAGEYDISSVETTYTETETDGDVTKNEIKITGNAGTSTRTFTEVGESPVTNVQNIAVNQGDYTFSKDGTWSRTFNTTATWTQNYDFIIDKIDYTEVETLVESGTWAFLGGETEDFKKKERLALDVLSSKSTSQTTSVTKYESGDTETDTGDTYTDTETLAHGEEVVVLEIDMLKKDEITFIQNLDGSSTNDDGDGEITGSTNVGSSTVKLTAK